jgi:hypothetical protein
VYRFIGECYGENVTIRIFFATKIIFRYSLQAHVLPEPADASYIAKDGLPNFPEGEESKLDLLYVPN